MEQPTRPVDNVECCCAVWATDRDQPGNWDVTCHELMDDAEASRTQLKLLELRSKAPYVVMLHCRGTHTPVPTLMFIAVTSLGQAAWYACAAITDFCAKTNAPSDAAHAIFVWSWSHDKSNLEAAASAVITALDTANEPHSLQ